MIGGAALGLVVVGAIGGVELTDQQPGIRNAVIEAPVHAGDNLAVDEDIIVPPGCIPHMEQRLCTMGPAGERDCNLPGTKQQVLTDSAMSGVGHPFYIPVPRDTDPRVDWVFHQVVSLPGCGALSGLLPARSTELHDTQGRLGVAVITLPYDEHPKH